MVFFLFLECRKYAKFNLFIVIYYLILTHKLLSLRNTILSQIYIRKNEFINAKFARIILKHCYST